MLEKIEKNMKDLPDNFIIGLVVKSNNYEEVSLHLLNVLINKMGNTGSYVAINKPYENVINVLDRHKIDHNKLFFIDCITKKLGGGNLDFKNCLFLDSPENLTELGIALHEYSTLTHNKKRFLFLDSISTLGIHNDVNKVLKFIHYLTGKMRLWDINGIMITLREETDRRLIAELSQFCDKIIKV